MFCKYCGKEVSEGTKFCPYCGKMLEENSVSSNINENNSNIVNPNLVSSKAPYNVLDRTWGGLTAAKVLLIINCIGLGISELIFVVCLFIAGPFFILYFIFSSLPLIFSIVGLVKLNNATTSKELVPMGICNIIFGGLLGIIAGILMLCAKDRIKY